jgi:hypothetical protein
VRSASAGIVVTGRSRSALNTRSALAARRPMPSIRAVSARKSSVSRFAVSTADSAVSATPVRKKSIHREGEGRVYDRDGEGRVYHRSIRPANGRLIGGGVKWSVALLALCAK